MSLFIGYDIIFWILFVFVEKKCYDIIFQLHIQITIISTMIPSLKNIYKQWHIIRLMYKNYFFCLKWCIKAILFCQWI